MIELMPIILQILGPLAIAGGGSYFSYHWGRRKTKEEVEKEKAETSVMVVKLVNEQLELAYNRIRKLEDEVTRLKTQNNQKDEKLHDSAEIIRAAHSCPFQEEGQECPVIRRQRDIERLNTAIDKSNEANS